jgi:hypothetical protein
VSSLYRRPEPLSSKPSYGLNIVPFEMRLRRDVTAVLTVLVVTGVLGGCGSDNDKIDQARTLQKLEDQAKVQRQQLNALERDVGRLARRLEKVSKPVSGSGGATSGGGTNRSFGGSASCGDGLTVNSNTSCTFAQIVKDEYLASGGGNRTIDVYSPVTGQTYAMTCSGGAPTVCRGGNNAAVYIR